VAHDILGGAVAGHRGSALAAGATTTARSALRQTFTQLGEALQRAAARSTTGATRACGAPAEHAATTPSEARAAAAPAGTHAGASSSHARTGALSQPATAAQTTARAAALALALGQKLLEPLTPVALRTAPGVSFATDHCWFVRNLPAPFLSLAAQSLEPLLALLCIIGRHQYIPVIF